MKRFFNWHKIFLSLRRSKWTVKVDGPLGLNNLLLVIFEIARPKRLKWRVLKSKNRKLGGLNRSKCTVPKNYHRKCTVFAGMILLQIILNNEVSIHVHLILTSYADAELFCLWRPLNLLKLILFVSILRRTSI